MKPQITGVDEHGSIWSDGIRRSAEAVRAMCCTKRERRRTPDQLTQRELQVLGHVADGCSNKEAARILGIEHFTVAEHLKRIFGVLEARDRAHAVAIALRKGLIS